MSFRRQHPLRPMTINAPAHRERVFLPDTCHRLNRAMALLTCDFPNNDMLTVIEVNEIGEIMHLDPLNRLVVCNSLLDLLDLGRIPLHPRMAIHADVGRWNPGMSPLLSSKMAVETRNLVITGMKFMRIMDRLFRLVALIDPHAASRVDDRVQSNPDHQQHHHSNENLFHHESFLLT